MTKAEVIQQILEQLDKKEIKKNETREREYCQEVIEHFLKIVKQSLTDGNNIYIRGFGSFIVKKRAKKVARNIAKNQPIMIDAHFIPAFKPSKLFAERVKKNTKEIEKRIANKGKEQEEVAIEKEKKPRKPRKTSK
ncbi:MAG: integration host factor subunit beta [Bacteroidia bacterium]|nr:integration host factor subunit beta [Bacteroidia bacterium]MDW8346080.1 HU family DNA-binding protein [Bacteroidia bacterium]